MMGSQQTRAQPSAKETQMDDRLRSTRANNQSKHKGNARANTEIPQKTKQQQDNNQTVSQQPASDFNEEQM